MHVYYRKFDKYGKMKRTQLPVIPAPEIITVHILVSSAFLIKISFVIITYTQLSSVTLVILHGPFPGH